MNKLASIFAVAATLLGIGTASAAGIPTLKTVANKQIITQKIAGMDPRVRAPKNASLQKYVDGGMMEGFVKVNAVKQTATGKIYQLSPGQYRYGNKSFVVRAQFAIEPRPLR